MPKYYCDYCDTYLTHDSPSVRKTHCRGRRHIDNIKMYYEEWMAQRTQQLIDATTAAFKAGSIASHPYQGISVPPPLMNQQFGIMGMPPPSGPPPFMNPEFRMMGMPPPHMNPEFRRMGMPNQPVPPPSKNSEFPRMGMPPMMPPAGPHMWPHPCPPMMGPRPPMFPPPPNHQP